MQIIHGGLVISKIICSNNFYITKRYIVNVVQQFINVKYHLK
jgi:hypothetical protein